MGMENGNYIRSVRTQNDDVNNEMSTAIYTNDIIMEIRKATYVSDRSPSHGMVNFVSHN